MEAVQNRFASLGDTAKSLYGDTYDDVKALIDTAAQMQRNNASKSSLVKGVIAAGTKKLIAGAGAAKGYAVGGPVGGAIGYGVGSSVGEIAENAILNFGKSGAVKIGISPTESIVLTPKQTMRAGMGKLIARFANAQKYGKPTGPS